MARFQTLMSDASSPSYILPLFWQHGESPEIIRAEIEQMHQNGIGGFIVESRPFPDFLGESWWENLRLILHEAKSRGMKVWVFDDSAFPSGFAGGAIRDRYPQYLKVYLRENHIDAAGPMPGASFFINPWLETGDTLIRAVAVRRTDGVDRFDAESAIDLSARVIDGRLYWDVPEGFWRVFLFIRTRNGGEDGTRDYLNPLDPEPVRAFIDTVHETHYAHFADEFGKTFAGFFTDEPRFGSFPSYEAILGNNSIVRPYSDQPMVLPYSDRLLDQLSEAWQGDFTRMLPSLWYDGGELTHRARFTYMDLVSKLFGRNFIQQIGDWCRDHKVELIGHVVEDNGAHTRLGFGSGHFFRSLRGQDRSGLDMVYQVWPEYTDGRMTSPFGYLDADFFYWGLAKMAASEGHIDPKKQGRTVCEIFGAYGWQAGLKLMKWLTDHACVRGVNLLIPHAFSPREFPDPDCPPHFYARGYNPQWRYFHIWSSYANRVCHLLSDGDHVAPVAVVYHAEAEWSGECEPFEKVVKTLAWRQIDCEVLPIDTLIDPQAATIDGDRLKVNRETYRALIVPSSEALPKPLLERLISLADHQIRILFMESLPTRFSGREAHFDQVLSRLKNHPMITIENHDRLADKLFSWDCYDILPDLPQADLGYYHYVHSGEDIYFFTNQNIHRPIRTMIQFKQSSLPVAYDALSNTACKTRGQVKAGIANVELNLEPYESIFFIFSSGKPKRLGSLDKPADRTRMSAGPLIDGDWNISVSTAQAYPTFKALPHLTRIGNLAASDQLPTFAGTIRYEIDFDFSAPAIAKAIFLDLGQAYEVAEVNLNGQPAGTRICPPYRLEVTDLIQKGINHLQVDVTNTLAKQYGENTFDRYRPQEPSGLCGPVQLWIQI